MTCVVVEEGRLCRAVSLLAIRDRLHDPVSSAIIQTDPIARGLDKDVAMPMVSQAQRAYLHIHHPQIAAEFESATPKGKKLPQHVGKTAVDTPQLAVQQYMPTSHRRALTDEEHADIHRGEKQWLPSIFQSYGTPLPSMLASPWKQGLLSGLAGAGIGGLAGAGIGSSMKTPMATGIGALAGAIGLGGTAGLVTGLSRSAKNEGIVEMMKRLPENAVKRDLMSDPAYQTDVKRENDNDNFSKMITMLQADRLMSPGTLSLGKFSSFDVLGRAARKIAENDEIEGRCHAEGCTPATPCEFCLSQKQANLFAPMGMGAIAGGAGGAALAPHGHHTEGLGRGVVRGAVTGGGVMAGGLTGALLGSQLSKTQVPSDQMNIAHLGALLGALTGGVGAYAGAGAAIGKPSWEEKREEKQACYPGCTKAKPCKMCRAKKANLSITPQPLSPLAGHDPFAGGPVQPMPAAHPGPALGQDPFHIQGGMAPQHGTVGPLGAIQTASKDPFGVHGLPVRSDPFGASTPPAAQPFNWGKHLADNKWSYGLGGAAAAALLYHLASRKKEREPVYA